MDKLRSLKVEEDYTLASFNMVLGTPYAVQFTLKDIRCITDWEGRESYHLIYKKRGVREHSFTQITYNKQFVIWEGHVDPLVDPVVTRGLKDFEGGAICVTERWPKLDPRYMLRAKRSVFADPVAEFIKPVPENASKLILKEIAE